MFFKVPKTRFKELGNFASMIFEKLRQDFLDIYPNENFIRNSYIKYLKINNNHKKRSDINNHDIDRTQKINWIPEQNILSMMKTILDFLKIVLFAYRSI